MKLKHSDLVAAVTDYTGLQIIEPSDREWGATFDLVAVHHGRLLGYLMVDQLEMANHIAAWVDPVIERMTNTWVMVTPDLLEVVAQDCPINAGLSVIYGWDDIRVIRPPSLLRPALHLWVNVLTSAERLELVPGIDDVSNAHHVADAAIEMYGELVSRETLTGILGQRLPPPAIQWDSLSPIELLDAAQKRIDRFRPAFI